MNIVLQCCGLAMLAVVRVFLRDKSLDVSSRRLYKLALYSCMFCLIMDIGSIIAIYYATYGSFPALWTRIICKIYLVTLVMQGYMGLLYTAGEYFIGGANRRVYHLYRLLLCFGSAAIVILPIAYYMDGMVVYSYGLADIATYIVAIVYITATIFMAFQASDRIALRRRRCILLWQGIWLTAALIQFLMPNLLLVGFAAAFGMVIIYAELENPAEGIDRMTGQFTANALTVFIDDLYRAKRPFSALLIRVEYRSQNLDPQLEKSVMLRLSNRINQERNVYVFHESWNALTVISPDEAKMRAIYEKLMDFKSDDLLEPFKVMFTLIPDGRVIRNADEFLQFREFYRKDNPMEPCVTVDAEMVERIRRYLQTRELINDALAENRVEVFFQPIFNVKRKCFTAAEALVRIRRHDGTLVPPGSFIPFAEETGLIVPLGIEIFRQVCSFLSENKAKFQVLEYIEVNLSVAQFDNENPARFVEQVLDEYKIEPDWINLEITETASSSARKIVLQNMNRLMKKGVTFSLDDFGTGFSNLDYLVNMPVEIAKFDFSFTQLYFESFKARCVVESVAGLLHRMGLSIVAEGVETKEQLQAMTEMGVDYIQGFYFSRPLQAKDFLSFLEANNQAVGKSIVEV